MKTCIFVATLLLAFSAPAQPHPSNLQGSWTATSEAQQTFRGNWSARVQAESKNAATGSWTLVNDTNQVVLEGTWTARKSAGGWQGTWSARARNGRPLSGTWQAAIGNLSVKTLADMLQLAAQKQISGSWQSGRARGNWWLQH